MKEMSTSHIQNMPSLLLRQIISNSQALFLTLLFYIHRLQRKKLPSYAPKSGIRYDGIYRIEKCWMKVCNEVRIMLHI